MNLITLEKVTKRYLTGEVTVNALKEISLTIESRSFVSFVGPSGSGKTTLLNLLGCLDKPSKGKITITGQDISLLDRNSSAQFRGNNIGFVFQNFNLIPVLTVFENVEYPLIMVQNIPVNERKDRILAMLDKVGMLNQKDKYPTQLSGGQKQRVAVARALITNPKLVLADEPTANLDHDSAYKVIGLMHEMKENLGTTFVFATHDPKIVGEAEIIHTIEDGLLINSQIQSKGGHAHA